MVASRRSAAATWAAVIRDGRRHSSARRLFGMMGLLASTNPGGISISAVVVDQAVAAVVVNGQASVVSS